MWAVFWCVFHAKIKKHGFSVLKYSPKKKIDLIILEAYYARHLVRVAQTFMRGENFIQDTSYLSP